MQEKMQEEPKKEHPTRFKKGQSGNPGGKAKSIYQPIEQRMQRLLEEYTVEEILKILNDKKELQKLSSIDYLAIMSIADGFTKGSYKARNSVYDRAYGKPKQTVSVDGLKPRADLSQPTTPEEARAAFLEGQKTVDAGIVASIVDSTE